MTLFETATLFVLGVFIGILNTLAGGGSALTLPVLMSFGLPAGVANGTNRIGIFLQTLVAAWKFKRADVFKPQATFKAAIPMCIGALCGSLVALEVSDVNLEKVIGVTMLGLALVMVGKPLFFGRVLTREPKELPSNIWTFAAFFAVGFYGGFIQLGVGLVLLVVMVAILRLPLMFSNAIKSALVMLFTIPALVVFIWSGKVSWFPALSLGTGGALGAYLGTTIHVGWGEKFARVVVVLAILGLGIKLIVGL